MFISIFWGCFCSTLEALQTYRARSWLPRSCIRGTQTGGQWLAPAPMFPLNLDDLWDPWAEMVLKKGRFWSPQKVPHDMGLEAQAQPQLAARMELCDTYLDV